MHQVATIAVYLMIVVYFVFESIGSSLAPVSYTHLTLPTKA